MVLERVAAAFERLASAAERYTVSVDCCIPDLSLADLR